MVKAAADLVKEAKAKIENLTPDQVSEELANGNAVLVDVREGEELVENGRIAGSVNVPRGFLEFSADPSSPRYKPEFGENKKIILHCASGSRSALAVLTLKEMGYENVAHLEGGMKAWVDSGKEVVD